MDLHGLARGAISAVNPFVLATVQISTGSTQNADGGRTPTYTTFNNVSVQVQALSYKDLAQVEGLNLNGTRRAIYVSGELDGVVRSLGKGGDLITLPDGSVYLVAMVLEQWPDWAKVAATLQDGS